MVYQSLQPLFSPKTVAIVGASRDKNSIGYSIVHNLVNSEFTGLVYPVNPKARAVHSIPCYPSLLEIPVDIDLAVVAVPRDNVLEVMKNALAKKVKALVIITAGFREVGEEGRLLEEKILQMARQGGIRMVGPNCMGIINTQPQISLNATFAPIPARPGHVGFVSQSGALGVAILNVADKLGLGLTQFISMGNKADVSGNDMLEYWEKASETRVIAMYLESFGNPKKFVHLARRIGKQKPILVVKSGRTPEGARAASSHTGALAAGDITISALLDSCGVVRVETIQELFDTARVFVKWQKVEGKNVAILTNAGGPAIMATDSCVGLGLEIPALSQNTRQRLSTFLPKEASLRNPVDMIAAAGEKEYAQALQTLLEEPEIHMVLVIFVPPKLGQPLEILESISKIASHYPDKPVLPVIMAEESFYQQIKGREDYLPVFDFPEPAAKTLAKLYRYSTWKEKPSLKPRSIAPEKVKKVEKILKEYKGQGYLPLPESFEILESYEIPVAKWALAQTKEEVLQYAQNIGFPLVLKGILPQITHKSDLGLVITGIPNKESLQKKVDELSQKASSHSKEVLFLIQEEIKGGKEIIFGITQEAKFGPLVMVGMGGKYVEIFQDIRLALPPLGPYESKEMLESLKGYPLLKGARGEEGVNLEKIQEVLEKVSLLAQHEEILEMDINPFMALPKGQKSCAVDIRIRV